MSNPWARLRSWYAARKAKAQHPDVEGFFDGVLAEDLAELVKEHLGDCERCQSEFIGLAQLAALGRHYLASHPQELVELVELEAKVRKRGSWWRRWRG